MVWLKSKAAHAVGVILVVAAVALTYVQNLSIVPAADSDELMLLSIPYRYVHYGDSNYRVLCSSSFNNKEHRKLPPPLCGILRNQIHLLMPFSDWSTRVISIFFILSAVFFCACGAARLAASAYVFIPVFVILACHPTVFTTARIMRFEQEIVFVGLLGLMGMSMLHSPRRRSLNVFLWVLQGVCVGLAACEHPWGAVFPATLLIAICLGSASWNSIDSLTFWKRLAAFLFGLLLPVTYMLCLVAQDWTNYVQCWQSTSSFYQRVDDLTASIYSNFFPNNPLAKILPVRLSAQINTLLLGACFRPVDEIIAISHRVALIAAIFSTVFFSATRLKVLRDQSPYFLLPITFFVTVLSWHFIYRPSENYVVYVVVATWLALLTIIIHEGWLKPEPSHRYRITLMIAMLPFAISFIAYFCQLNALTMLSTQGCSADQLIEALQRISNRLNWKNSTGKTYIDFVCWAAGKKNSESLADIVYIPDQPGRNLDDLAVMDTFEVDNYLDAPNFGPVQLTPKQKAERLTQFLKDLNYAAVTLYTGRQICFFQPNELPEDQKLFGKITASGMTLSHLKPAQTAESGDGNAYSFSTLPTGVYLLEVMSSDFRQNDFEIKLTTKNHSESLLQSAKRIANVVPQFFEIPSQLTSDDGPVKITVIAKTKDAFKQVRLLRQTDEGILSQPANLAGTK